MSESNLYAEFLMYPESEEDWVKALEMGVRSTQLHFYEI